MAIPAEFKYDVRVRERLLGDGVLSESDLKKHIEGLPDLDGQAVELTIKQPALSNETDRDIVIVKTSGVRPPVAPIRPTDDDLPIPDDDDLDDDDDIKPEAKKVAEKAVEKAVEKPVVKAKEVVADEDEDDDDDDDEDEDEEEKDEEAPAEGGETP